MNDISFSSCFNLLEKIYAKWYWINFDTKEINQDTEPLSIKNKNDKDKEIFYKKIFNEVYNEIFNIIDLAIYNENYKFIIYCIYNKKIDINFKNCFGLTLVHRLCQLEDNIKIFNIFINAEGFDVNVYDNSFSNSLLHYICINNKFNYLKIIINNKNLIIDKYNKHNHTPIYYTCVFKNKECLEILLSHSLTIDFRQTYLSKSLLMICLENNFYDGVDIILKSGKFEINRIINFIEGKTILHYVAKKQKNNIFEKLLLYGADINSFDYYGNSVLHIACENNNNFVIRSVVDYVKKTKDNNIFKLKNIKGYTPLHIACLKNNIYAVDILSDYININEENKNKETALYLSSKNGYIDIVKILLKKKDIIIN